MDTNQLMNNVIVAVIVLVVREVFAWLIKRSTNIVQRDAIRKKLQSIFNLRLISILIDGIFIFMLVLVIRIIYLDNTVSNQFLTRSDAIFLIIFMILIAKALDWLLADIHSWWKYFRGQ